MKQDGSCFTLFKVSYWRILKQGKSKGYPLLCVNTEELFFCYGRSFASVLEVVCNKSFVNDLINRAFTPKFAMEWPRLNEWHAMAKGRIPTCNSTLSPLVVSRGIRFFYNLHSVLKFFVYLISLLPVFLMRLCVERHFSYPRVL